MLYPQQYPQPEIRNFPHQGMPSYPIYHPYSNYNNISDNLYCFQPNNFPNSNGYPMQNGYYNNGHQGPNINNQPGNGLFNNSVMAQLLNNVQKQPEDKRFGYPN